MGNFYARPSSVVPQFGHPILNGQSLWLVADKDKPPGCILTSGYAAMSFSSDHIRDATSWGTAFDFPIGTSVMDMGSSNRFLSSESQPCSFAWVERPEINGLPVGRGICHLKPAGSANSFQIGRTDNTVIDATHGGTISVGMHTGVPTNHPGSLVPPRVSAYTPLVFVITSAGGCNSTTLSDWSFYWGGGAYGNAKPSGTTSVNVAAATQNYFGYDNARNVYLGALDNMRIWNRCLSREECVALVQDPYLGCIRKRYSRMTSNPSSAWFAPWTMMPTGVPV